MRAPCPAVGGEGTPKLPRVAKGPCESQQVLGGGGGLWGEKGRAEDPAFREGAAPGEQSWGGACAETRDAWLRPVETSARSSGGRGGGLPRALRGGRSPLQDLWAARSRSRKVSQPQSGEGPGEEGLGRSPFSAPDRDAGPQPPLLSFRRQQVLLRRLRALRPDSVGAPREASVGTAPLPTLPQNLGSRRYW